MTDSGPGRPGRPRNVAINDVVLDAAIQLLSEHGFHGVSMEDIAAHAHTGKDTLYRRWPSKRRLVNAALDHLVSGSINALPSEEPRDGLVGYLLELDRLVTSTPIGHIVASSVGEAAHDAEIAEWLSAFWSARVAEAARLIDDSMDGGGNLEEVGSIALDLLFGALFYRWFVQQQLVTPAYVHQLAWAAFTLARPASTT
jgi:AcrR family transcriptional regulator